MLLWQRPCIAHHHAITESRPRKNTFVGLLRTRRPVRRTIAHWSSRPTGQPIVIPAVAANGTRAVARQVRYGPDSRTSGPRVRFETVDGCVDSSVLSTKLKFRQWHNLIFSRVTCRRFPRSHSGAWIQAVYFLKNPHRVTRKYFFSK